MLLGEKKKGFGRGKLVGPGGKLEAGETPRQSAVREVFEECGLLVAEDDLVPLGRFRFEFPHQPAWSQLCWVFSARDWQGEMIESDELFLRWHPVDALPLERMWDDARHWLPEALAGNYVVRSFTFGADLSAVDAGHRGAATAS